MISVEAKFTNSAAFRRRVKSLMNRVSNTRPLMHKISIFLEQWVLGNFKTEGAPYGGWKPLAAGGRWKKGKFDPSAKKLQDTGQLRASFKGFHSEKNAGVGSTLPYAPTHDEGLGRIPQRKILPTDQLIMKDVLKKVNQHINKALKK